MRKTMGLFVGYRKFAPDYEWLKREKEMRYQQEFKKWSEKWITVTRLKETRLWTDSAIKRWLGQPVSQGKYKVFPVSDVRNAESLQEFQKWRQIRMEKKQSRTIIPFL